MLVKLDHFPKVRGEHKKMFEIWNHHPEMNNECKDGESTTWNQISKIRIYASIWAIYYKSLP